MRAAVALGCEYLARVCLEAVDADGHVLEYSKTCSIQTRIGLSSEGMFVQELSRGLDVFFINAPVELGFYLRPVPVRPLARLDLGSACWVGEEIPTDTRPPARSAGGVPTLSS